MSVYPVKLPDVGEGVAEAELIAWHVSVGDMVSAESTLAEVMTDKATVEISSPVAGTVTFLRGEVGDVLAVGSEFVGIETGVETGVEIRIETGVETGPESVAAESAVIAAPAPTSGPVAPNRPAPGGRALAAPAVRARAAALGIDLATVPGSGPDGRVVHADLDARLAQRATRPPAPVEIGGEGRVEPVRGLRRRIADRLTTSWSEIPHITYVEAVDATEVEELRAELNGRHEAGGPRLTLLPFLAKAIVLACAEQPRLNARYDAVAQQLAIAEAVHLGIATQTPDGLMVPVVRNAERRGLWDLAGEIGRVSGAARGGTATSQELSGSTITITSLGALGGLVTTPIINHPEVAIVGVNKLETRAVWRNEIFEPRLMFNLSCSFDHRIVDGWDAATFVQRLKSLLEMPALLFVGED